MQSVRNGQFMASRINNNSGDLGLRFRKQEVPSLLPTLPLGFAGNQISHRILTVSHVIAIARCEFFPRISITVSRAPKHHTSKFCCSPNRSIHSTELPHRRQASHKMPHCIILPISPALPVGGEHNFFLQCGTL